MKRLLFTTPNLRLVRAGKKTNTLRLIDGAATQREAEAALCRYGVGRYGCPEPHKILHKGGGKVSVLYTMDGSFRNAPMRTRERYDQVNPSTRVRPPRFMFDEFIRLFASVTSVQRGRIQDLMTPELAVAEGVGFQLGQYFVTLKNGEQYFADDPISAFVALWDDINPKAPYAQNRFVFSIAFEAEWGES